MLYYGYHFWGMHLVWWFVWVMVIFWLFMRPYNIITQKPREDSPLDTLKKRLASGQIDIEEYQARKKVLEGDSKN